MDHADRTSRFIIPRAKADPFAVDLILDCERAASRRNPRDCDPTQWSRSAWRRYLHAAAHAPSLVNLQCFFCDTDLREGPPLGRSRGGPQPDAPLPNNMEKRDGQLSRAARNPARQDSAL